MGSCMDKGLKERIGMCVSAGDYKEGLEKLGFDRFQCIEIKKGADAGLDIYSYASPEFDAAQMKSIRLGLSEGLDVSVFVYA